MPRLAERAAASMPPGAAFPGAGGRGRHLVFGGSPCLEEGLEQGGLSFGVLDTGFSFFNSRFE